MHIQILHNNYTVPAKSFRTPKCKALIFIGFQIFIKMFLRQIATSGNLQMVQHDKSFIISVYVSVLGP